MERFTRVLALLIAVLGAGVVWAVSADASSVTCEERFPQVEWVLAKDGDIAVYTSGVHEAMTERFGREISLVSEWIESDIGPVDVAVCLVGESSAFVGDEFASGSVAFHAHQDLEERFILIETQRPSFVSPAASFAIAHQALWQNNGNEAFPEPIASVIGQFYRARILERLDLYHAEVMMDNFFDTESVIDWTESVQEPIQDWIPESNFRAIGDFVDFAVSEHGTGVLLETDGARWSELEAEWRAALRADLTGRDTPTTDWAVGVGIAIAIVMIALIAIALGVYSKRRKKNRPETAPPVPGFFTEQ